MGTGDVVGAILEGGKIFGYAKNPNKNKWKKNIAGSNAEHRTLFSVAWLFKHLHLFARLVALQVLIWRHGNPCTRGCLN